MKAEELRIGNLIYLKHGGLGYKGHFVTKSTISIYYDNQYEFMKPIPLTEDWLLKFRFIKSTAAKSIYLSIPELKAEIHFEFFRGGLVCVLYCSTGSFIPNDIKHVHQLQNLYFALTGEELKIQ
jgi:hypothetical protein